MPVPRNVLFITLDQWRGDCLSALGHPVLETPTLDALAGRGVLFRKPLGQCSAVRTFAGVPLHGHVPAPQSLDPERHPVGRPVHQRGAPGSGGGLRPGALRVHGLVGRPAYRAVRRPEVVQLRGGASRIPGRDRRPLGKGESGLGTLARRAGVRRPGQPARPVRADRGVPGGRCPRLDLGSRRAFLPSSPRRASCASR